MNGFGGNNFLWILILIILLGGNGCGCGFNNIGGANTDDCSWIIILILLLCCCGNNNVSNSGCNMCEA